MESEEDEQEHRDKTIERWDKVLGDPYCEYYGLDKISAIDILVEYDNKRVPRGRYTIEEVDAFYNIADYLQYISDLPLRFRRLVNAIVWLQEMFYSPILDQDQARYGLSEMQDHAYIEQFLRT